MKRHPTSGLAPYACFACHCAFKRPDEADVFWRKCQTCGGRALRMDVRFRAPKKSDDKQWAKVRYLAEHGFVYQKVYRKRGDVWSREEYPQNLEQARDFVTEFRDQALPIPPPPPPP